MKFKKVRVINITASEDVLLERLTARARDSVESIKERIARSKMLEPNGPFVIDVVNEGTREEGIQGVVDALQAYEPRPPPRVIFMADGHADPASQLAIASAVQAMELTDGVDLWMEMILPEEVRAMRVAFEEPPAAENFFLDMEQQGEGAAPEEPPPAAAAEEEVRPAEPEEGVAATAGEESGTEDVAEEEAEEEVEPYGGLYCDEAALSEALKVPLARLGWPAELEASLVSLLRTAHAHGSVLHALDEPEFTLAAFEEKWLAEPAPAAAEGEEEAPPAPSEDAQRFKARMEYAHDRVNRASHRWLERLEAYGGMGARPQLLLCGAEHWQTLADGLKTRGSGEPVSLEALAVQPVPPATEEPAEGEEAPPPATPRGEETEVEAPAAELDPIAVVTKACEERNALLRAPRSASLFGDAESEDDMEVEPMLGAVLGIHHPTLFAPAAIEE